MNLGKLLKVGHIFFTSTKTMDKNRRSGNTITYEVLRPGDKRFFTKGKRRYFCEVLALQETKVGYYRGSISTAYDNISRCPTGKRYWQFTYMVKVLEN